MKKLRLLFTEKCNRACEGCCNKQWDLKKLPVCDTYKGYDEIYITGGEPMLYVSGLRILINTIRLANPTAKLYLYTAKIDDWVNFKFVLTVVDGVTVTIHTQEDFKIFERIDRLIPDNLMESKSMRLNIFEGIFVQYIFRHSWDVKENIKWINPCPLPKDEVFMRVK